MNKLAAKRIGLLGGSFDPAHEGHIAISKAALQRLGLDRIWWLVSPGNPLKQHKPAPSEIRIAQAKAFFSHPRIEVLNLEEQLGTRFSLDTITALKQRFLDCRFVWIMGADNLYDFHNWQNWQMIFHSIPIAVFARPGARASACRALAPRCFHLAQSNPNAAQQLVYAPPPAWCFLNIPLNSSASRLMRDDGAKQGGR